MTENLLEIEEAAVSYGAVPALRGVSATVHEGEIVAIVGPNGAGKTTLVRAIAGLERLRAGQIRLAGTSLGGKSPEQRARKGLVMVPQGRRIFPEASVRQNLWAGAYSRKDRREVDEDIDGFLTMFPALASRADAEAGVLSGGEQQMLAIARALMARPTMLLLDEPSMGLAPIIVRRIFDVLQELHDKGTTMLLVEQNVTRALEVADRLYVLRNGEVVASAIDTSTTTVDDLLHSYMGL